jgi:branched-chain amino acid aminotransferase
MPVPYSPSSCARDARADRAQRLRSCYIRPIVFRGYGQMGLNPLDAPVDVTIACWEWGAYLGEEGKRDGIRAKVSSWRADQPRSLIPHAKASGQYLNSVLAKIESVKAGYDEAILLDDHGHVCEGTGENIYVVRDGEIITPPQHNSILDGITRRSVLQIARDLGYTVVERDIARAELYLADEVFLSGTAAELVPVREIDDHAIGTGKPGEITRVLQSAFDDAIHGRTERYREWLDVSRRGSGRAPRWRSSGSAGELCGRPASALSRAVGRCCRPHRRPLLQTTSANIKEPVNTIQLYDATLRDGMQGEGMSLSAEEKLRVAHALDELGVD